MPTTTTMATSPFARAGTATLVIVALAAVLLVFEPLGTGSADDVGRYGYLLAGGLGLLFALVGARRRSGRARLPWLCLAAAEACWLVANAFWSSYSWVLEHRPPFASPYDLGPAFGDALYLTANGLLIAAVAILLRGAVTARNPLRLVLDALLVGTSLFYLAWAVLLGGLPTIDWSVDRALTWAYPVFDVALAAVALVALSRTNGKHRPRWLLLTGAMMILAVGDTFWAYVNLQGWFQSGSPLDLAWIAGYLLVGLAALADSGDRSIPAAVSSRWTAVVPYVPLLLVLVAALVRLDEPSDPVLTVAGIVALALLLVRQVVAVLENQRLAREFEAAVRARTAELAELAAIVDVARDAMVTLRVSDGCVLTWNAAAESMFGYRADEMIGRSVDVLVADEAPAENRPWLRGCQSTPLDIRLRRQDGTEIYASVLSAPIHDERDEVVAAAVVMRDVTKQRALDEQARQSQKMEAVGRLAAGIAHDFNNLLTVIGGYSDVALARSADADRELRQDLTEIRRASEQAAGLTRQLLAFSRRQVLQPEILDLNAVVAEQTSMLRRIVGEDVSLQVELDSSGCFVEADPGQLSQVLLNLAANARDAMPAGGGLSIRTERLRLHAIDAALGLDPGRYVVLEISDTGAGLAPDAREHLFEPFFTTKDVGKGTGLGLSTVLGIVEQSQGRIAVDSELGAGTTFRIYLPEHAPPAATAAGIALTVDDAGETVLLVEDDDAVRDLVQKLLTRAGYAVLTAATPERALELQRTHGDEIQLVVTDVVMPGMNGWELARRLRRQRPDLGALFVSGYPAETVMARGEIPAGTVFLQKPFVATQLTAKVREAIDTRSPAATG